VLGRLLLGSLRARRSRVLLSLLAVTLGTGVATALATLALQVGDDLARTLRAAGPNFVLRPEGAAWRPEAGGDTRVARAGVALPEGAVSAMKSTFWKHNVLEAAPELDVSLRAGGRSIEATGTWFARDVATEDGPWPTGLSRLHPMWRITGAWPAENGQEIALGSALARRLDARVGESLVIDAAGGRETVHVSSVVEAGGLDDLRAWLPLPLAQRLVQRPGELDRVALSALVLPETHAVAPDASRDPRGFERFMCTAYPANVARDLALAIPGTEVIPMTELVAGEAAVVRRLHLLMLLLAAAALTASALGLLSTTTATVVERAREFGLMRALGATSSQLAVLLLAETLLVSLAGGGLGWLAGTAAAAAIRGHAFAAPVAAQPLLLPAALLVAAAIAVAGTLAPLRVALRFDPVEVLRG
jgi:putative ABC transport system permease protein